MKMIALIAHDKKKEEAKLETEKEEKKVSELAPSKPQEVKGSGAAQKKGAGRSSQAKIETVQPEPVEEKATGPEDPNKNKFIPQVVHLERSLIKT